LLPVKSLTNDAVVPEQIGNKKGSKASDNYLSSTTINLKSSGADPIMERRAQIPRKQLKLLLSQL
jgi:hypothetical protein